MARRVRKLSATGMYHVIFRGISRQNIFEDESDKEKILKILLSIKNSDGYELFAYCLMSNHVHLFIKEPNIGDISKIMKKVLSQYAMWFNVKYQRTGALFENRYKSEPIEDERYFLSLVRYIHQNPLKAGLISQLNEYKWSSYKDYVGRNEDLVDIDFILSTLSTDKEKAVQDFEEFNNIVEFEKFDITSSINSNPERVRRIVINELDGQEPHTLRSMPKAERNAIIKNLIINKGISKSALERATGISRGTITRIAKM